MKLRNWNWKYKVTMPEHLNKGNGKIKNKKEYFKVMFFNVSNKIFQNKTFNINANKFTIEKVVDIILKWK